ncbi:uncharacterized protein DUF3822 [Nonlabens xylanidelens]|uniref:Uncharacterized protein DUF3822 n=1 Tax=Nonlabens xylanidelens TaxID=191564 RepID=A0A2S6IGM8_9FLAO|nr:DUF3822 family protein [Nonlabens xylanidelens]PPK93347.1 uncharacterized protein DUF3822 [Nonlabens xylanidelens]
MRLLLVVTGRDSMHLTTTSPNDTIKKLSVLIHQDGLSFYTYNSTGIIDSLHKEFKHSANPIEILQIIETCFREESFLDSAFAKATLLYHHNIFTSVPALLYNEDHAADYLKYNARILETDVLSVDENLGETGVNTVYIAYSNINNYFFERYGSYEYYHYSSRILEARSKSTIELQPQVYLDIKDSHFYLSIFNKGKLVAHNLFPHDAIEDILYYTMFTTHHNDLDPETMKMVVCNEEKNEALLELLYTYVRYVTQEENYPNYLEQIICV